MLRRVTYLRLDSSFSSALDSSLSESSTISKDTTLDNSDGYRWIPELASQRPASWITAPAFLRLRSVVERTCNVHEASFVVFTNVLGVDERLVRLVFTLHVSEDEFCHQVLE